MIGKYVRQVLEEGHEVVLPGFATLTISERSQGVRVASSQLAPPGAGIRVDSARTGDNGLLAEAYAGGGQVSLEEAGQQVLELVDAIRFALDRGEVYALSDVGTFTRDDDGRVKLKPDASWLIEPEQYGLEAVDLEELPEEEEAAPPLTGIEGHPEIPSAPPVTPAGTDSGVTPLAPPVQQKKKPARKSKEKPVRHKPERAGAPKPARRKWRVIYLVVVLLVIVLAVLLMIPVDLMPGGKRDRPEKDQTEQQARDAGTDQAEGREADRADPDLASSEDEGAISGQEGTESLSGAGTSGTAEEPIRPRVEDKFFLIAGSFQQLKNASELQDQLKTLGHEGAEVMATENRMYRVSVASFATKAEAEVALKQLQSRDGLQGVWLLAN